MHLRRALLLMAVVLFAVAIVEAAVPGRGKRAGDSPVSIAPPVAGAPARTLKLGYPSPEEPPRLRVAPGAHVVLEVSTTVPGEASIPGLGLVQAAEPATPARFDIIGARAGAYDVAFEPAAAGSAKLGRLVVLGAG